MDKAQETFTRIQKVLKFHPRGLTITEIARKTHLNRNSVASDLEILRVTGQVEMRQIGSAKIYFPAQRVPLSAFLCFTKNLVIVLDGNLNVVQINDQCLKLAQREKNEVLGKSLGETNLPVVSTPEALSIIEGLEREQIVTDIRYAHNEKELYFQMQVIPTTFEDGEKGSTIVLEDITERKQYVSDMEFLARTAMELIDMPPEQDIYQYITNRISELYPKRFIQIMSYDDQNRQFTMRSLRDQEQYKKACQVLGHDAIGMTFPVTEIILNYMKDGPLSMRNWGARKFVFWPERGSDGLSLYEICFEKIPRDVCENLCKTLNIGKVYYIFLVWGGQLYGNIGVYLPPDEDLKDTHVIESFARQVSLAIARRMTEDRLRHNEQGIRKLIELTPIPVSIISGDGRCQFLNSKFIEVFGYSLNDIPTGEEWFRRAFPDIAYRKEAIDAWNSGHMQVDAGKMQSRIFRVRCGNGEDRTVHFCPVTLADGNKCVMYEIVGTN
jgi:PAS domain-containing protein